MATPRRGFLAALAAAGASLGWSRVAQGADAAALASDPWLARLTGRQKVVFHSHDPADGLALKWARSFLDAQRDAYGRTDADSSVVVGLNGRAVGLAFSDALWARYPVGAVLEVPTAAAPARRNPFAAHVPGDPPSYAGATMPALQARGVVILVCDNSLRQGATRFVRDEPVTPERQRAFHAEATAHLLPGVFVVPAMVVALELAQSHGCRYIHAG